jgi:Ca2+-binding EF-hand superfamily protein
MQREEVMGARGRIQTVPPVIEVSRDDPSLRPVRMLLKRYEKSTGKGSTGDNRLTNKELKLDAKAFEAADSDQDGSLDTDEMRRFLANPQPDLELIVQLSGKGPAPATIEVAGESSKTLPAGVRVERLSATDVEVTLGGVSLEFHADAGENALAGAKQFYAAQFAAADADNNKYLEAKEVKDRPTLAPLFSLMDKDGDGKLFMAEGNEYVDRESQAAQSQMVLDAADQGRAIFAIMDLNRDRHLGMREIRGTVARVSSWDRDGDGQVSADEIPHHYQLSIGRGQVAPIGGPAAAVALGMQTAPPEKNTPGPAWFKRMDRNRDGDLSRREFLGTRTQFEQLDADGDGLINADEAEKAKAKS